MKRRLGVIALNLIFFIFLLLLMEIAVRFFRPDILKQSLSVDLFTPERFKESLGNTPSITGAAFGIPVTLDAQGFRAGANGAGRGERLSCLLVGDSVGFGAGVKDDEAFAQVVNQRDIPVWIENSSVIGYGMRDYYNFLSSVDIKKYQLVIIGICLNDIIDSSPYLQAQVLDEKVRRYASSFFTRLKYWSKKYFDFNKFLGEYSRLYLFLKVQADPQMHQTVQLKDFYESPEYIRYVCTWMEKISALTKDKLIRTIVVIYPFEYQLRTQDPAWLLPQRKIKEIAGKLDLQVYDLYPLLADYLRGHPGLTSKDIYLTGHESHFSPLGHRIVAGLFEDILTRQEWQEFASEGNRRIAATVPEAGGD